MNAKLLDNKLYRKAFYENIIGCGDFYTQKIDIVIRAMFNIKLN